MSKSLRNLLIVLGVAALLLALGIPKWREMQKKEAKPAAAKGPGGGKPQGPVPVNVVALKPGSLENIIQATGTVLPDEQVELRSEIQGIVSKIFFKEGARVKKGQVLVQIEAAELQAQLRKLQAQQELSEQSEKRSRALLEKEYISRQEYEQALTSYRGLQADIAGARAQLANATIRAPFDGVIGLKSISEGAYITPATPIANLLKLKPLKIDFSVPARYNQEVQPGGIIRFSLEGQDTTFQAKIYAIEPGIDPNTRTLQVRARYDNPGEAIKPGAFARIEVPLNVTQTALTVPTEAVVPVASGHQVFKLKGGKAVPQDVQIGQRTEKSVEITKGLAAGDTIITTGVMQLRPGSVVEITQIQ